MWAVLAVVSSAVIISACLGSSPNSSLFHGFSSRRPCPAVLIAAAAAARKSTAADTVLCCWPRFCNVRAIAKWCWSRQCPMEVTSWEPRAASLPTCGGPRPTHATLTFDERCFSSCCKDASSLVSYLPSHEIDSLLKTPARPTHTSDQAPAVLTEIRPSLAP